MNFKYTVVSCFALLGVIGSAFGFSFINNSAEGADSVSSDSLNTIFSDSSEENTSTVCSSTTDSFSQDESSVLASEYSKTGTADCMFVGCGGII